MFCNMNITVIFLEISWKEVFCLTTHSTHFIYGYMAKDLWQRTIQIAREETRCRHIGYSFRLTARVLLYATSHRQDSTYHGFCYTSRGALAGMRNSSMRDRSDVTSHHERTLLPRSFIYIYIMYLRGKSVRSWYDGSSDRSFMVDPLSYFSFQLVIHDWCNKGCGMCYPVCGMVHITETLLLIGIYIYIYIFVEVL